MKIDLVHGYLGVDGCSQFPARYNVETHTFFLEHLGQGRVDVGLAGIADIGGGVELAELIYEAATARPQCVFV